MAKANDSNSFMTNMITAGTKVTGDIVCNSDIRIEGTLHGNVTVKGKLVLGATGEIKGEINCQNCDIEGLVDGKVAIKELLSLRSTAKVIGDVVSGKLAIEPGAVFTGSCSMNNEVSNTPLSAPIEKK